MFNLLERLRQLSRHEHSDLSIGDEAADEIVWLTQRRNAIDEEAFYCSEALSFFREENKFQQDQIADLGAWGLDACDKIDQLREENERLRLKNAELRKTGKALTKFLPDHDERMGKRSEHQRIVNQFLEALEQGGEG